MTYVTAYTASTGYKAYPSYINMTEDHGVIRVTVRAAEYADPVKGWMCPGVTLGMSMNREEAIAFFRQGLAALGASE